MDKIRISVYWKAGNDKDGNRLVEYFRDDLVDIQLGIVDEEEDIKVKIIGICASKIIIDANGTRYPLHKGDKLEFDCCTGYYSGVSSDNQYFFVFSWQDDDINNYDKTRYQPYKKYIKQ